MFFGYLQNASGVPIISITSTAAFIPFTSVRRIGAVSLIHKSTAT
jgi:hypothetical protein